MSLTVGTVDIAVKLNTAGFEQDVQKAVAYTTKAFNSIDMSKAFQNQFKQATNEAVKEATTMTKTVKDTSSAVRQVAQTIATSTQQAVTSAMSGASKTVSGAVTTTSKEAEKLINKLEEVKAKAKALEASWGKELDVAAKHYGYDSPQYNNVFQMMENDMKPYNNELTNLNQKIAEYNQKIEEAKASSSGFQLSNIFSSFKTQVDDTKLSIDNMGTGLTAIGGKLATMGGTAGKLGTVLTGVGSVLSKFAPYVAAAVVALKTAWTVAVKLKHAVEDAFEKVKETASALTSKIGNAINSLTSKSDTFENAWGGALNRLIVLMGSLFSAGKIYSFLKESVTAAGDMESALYGLATMAKNTGNSFENAQKFITEYTKDGLVTISDAVTAYKTLISAQYTEQQTKDIMNAFKDTAAFGRQSGKTISQAVKEASEGIKNQNSVMTDNAGVTKNLSVMYKEYAASIGTTEGKLTEAQKRMAIYEGMLKEAQLSQGNAAIAADTFNGRLSKLGATFYNLKIAIGNVFLPVLNLIIPVLNNILLALTRFFNGVANLLSLIGLEVPNVESVMANISGGMSSVGGAASDTAEDIAGTGDAAKKAAKDINKAFANVDEIHVLDFNKSKGSGSGSSVGGYGGGVGTGSSEDTKPSGGLLNELSAEAIKKGLEEKARILADGINKALDSIDWEPIKAKAKFIASNIAAFLNAFIKELDWTLIGYTIAEGLNTALTFANTFLEEFDFYQLGSSIAEGLSSMVHNIDWDLLGQTIGNYFNSTIHFIDGFVTDFTWIELGVKLAQGLKSAIKTIDFESLAHALYTGVNGMFSTILAFVTGNGATFWTDLGKELATRLNDVIYGINWKQIGETLGQSWNAVWDVLYNVVEDFDWEVFVNDIIRTLNTFIETADLEKAGKTIGDLISKVLKAGIKLLKDVDWEKALDEFLEGVDLAQIILDYYTLENNITWAKFKIIGKLILDAIWDGIVLAVESFLEDMGTFFHKYFIQPWIDVADGIEEDKGLLEIGGDIIKGIFAGINGTLAMPYKLMKELIFDPIWTGICLAFGIASPAKEMEPIGENIIKGIFNGVTKVKEWLTKKWAEVKKWFTDPEVGFKAKWETTKENVQKWYTDVKSWWGTKTLSIKNKFDTLKNNVQTWYNNVKSWWGTKTLSIKNKFDTVKNNVSTWYNNVKTWWGTKTLSIKNKFDTVKNTVTSWYNKVKGWWGDRTLSIKAKISDVTGDLKKWINTNFVDKVNAKLPSWLGKIPRLATGGYVAANNPQLAIVGDNRREGEIITPESKIYEQVAKALKDNSNETIQKQEFEITIVHKYESGKQIIQKINSEQIKQGKILLLT